MVLYHLQESHQIIVSGLMSLWPNLQLQSEESDMPLIGGEPVSRKNSAVMSVANRDETVSIGEGNWDFVVCAVQQVRDCVVKCKCQANKVGQSPHCYQRIVWSLLPLHICI